MSFLTGYSRKKPTGRRKDERGEETTRKGRGYQGRRGQAWHEGVDRTERERNDNPFDGHNAARHRKAHQTRNTANRTPTPTVSSSASSSLYLCFHLSPAPKSSRRTYPWLYANRHRSPRPVINLLNYITRGPAVPLSTPTNGTSYKCTTLPSPQPYRHPTSSPFLLSARYCPTAFVRIFQNYVTRQIRVYLVEEWSKGF